MATTQDNPLQPGAPDVVAASVFRRGAAAFIDLCLVAGPFWILFFAVDKVGELGIGETLDAVEVQNGQLPAVYYQITLGMAAVYFLLTATYVGLCESSRRQATIGKRLALIKVVDRDDRKLGFAHAVGRWAASTTAYATLGIGLIMAAFSPDKRALHDILSDTRVVDRSAYTSSPELQRRRAPKRLYAAVALLLVTPPLSLVVLVLALTGSLG